MSGVGEVLQFRKIIKKCHITSILSYNLLGPTVNSNLQTLATEYLKCFPLHFSHVFIFRSIENIALHHHVSFSKLPSVCVAEVHTHF